MKVLAVAFMTALLFSALAFTAYFSMVQAAAMWTQTYGGPKYDEAFSLVEATDGGYALAGYTDHDFWLVKTDASGNAEWNQTYGGEWPDYAYSLVAASDGGYALAGYTESFAVEDPDVIPLPDKPADFWLVKTDEFGNVEWNQTYGGKADERAFSLVETSDGGYALVGGALLVKTDEFGNVEWNQTYGGSLVSLVVAFDGGYVLAGSTDAFGAGYSDFWLVKTDEYGDVEWNQTYGGAEDDIASSLVVTSDGGYAIAGRTYSLYSDFWLVKTDEYGNMQWNQTYGGADWEYCHSLVVTSDGGYAIAGRTSSFGAGYSDFWLVKTDAFGNVEWNQTYGGADWENCYSLVVSSDGGYALAGSTRSFGAGGHDFWLVKTDETGMFEPTPTLTPTASPTPTPASTDSPLPTASPTQQPTPNPTPPPEEVPFFVYLAVGTIVSALVTVGIAYLLMKRR